MRLFGILLALVGVAVTAQAQTNDVEIRTLSLEDCIQIALQHNLSVQIKRYDPEVSRLVLASAYGYYDPSFSVSGERQYNQWPGGIDSLGRPYGGAEEDINSFNSGFSGTLPWGTYYNFGANVSDTYGTQPGTSITNTLIRVPFEEVSGSVGLFQLQQPLLKNFWIDNARLQILLDKKNLKISELDLRSLVISTITSVEQAYYNLIFDQENIKVQEKALELAESTVAENKKRVEIGAMAPLDKKQAEYQAAASRADLLAAQSTEQTQQRVLKNLLSDNYSQWHKAWIQPSETLVAVPVRFDLAESWRRGLSERPDLLQAKLSIEKQGYVVRYQKNQMFPELDIIGSAGYNASSETGLSDALDQVRSRDNPFWTVGGQMTIPLGNISARNNYRSAKAAKEQLKLQLKQLEQTILIGIEDALAVTRTSFERVGATREARVYAEAALAAEQRKLESGKSTSFQVLILQRDLTTARSTEIRALADYNNALASLAQSEGSTLERRHVSLKVR